MNEHVDPQRRLPSKPRLQSLKNTLVWGGIGITLGGIVLGVVNDGSRDGACLSAVGLLITCCSHAVTGRIAKYQSAEQKADKQRLADFMQASMDGAYVGLADAEDAKVRKIIEDIRKTDA